MKSVRLKTICSFLNETDKMVDIGCDHAYVCIEMYHRGSRKILATDIHENALAVAKQNIEAEKIPIPTQISDGLESIDTIDYDTLIIAGMGFSTIKHILQNEEKMKPIKKMILQSNNDLQQLRVFLNQIGFSIETEIFVKEAEHFYSIMKCQKGCEVLSVEEIEFGKYRKENQEYYSATLEYYKNIFSKIPENFEEKRIDIQRKIEILKRYYLKSSL